MRKNYKKTEHYEIWVDEGIMYFIYTKNIDIDLNIAIKMVNERIEFSQGKDWPTLVILNNIGTIDKASKRYFANEGIQNMKCLAILANNTLDALIATLFVRCTGFPIPIKIFSNKNKSLPWLEQYKESRITVEAIPLSMTS